MRELSLFTGAGGGIYGSKFLGWRTIGYVEWEDYPQRVIAQRIKDGIFDRAPIFTDVREFVQSGAARQYRGFVDVVTGGFPCQPFSVAGKRKAGNDSRNMWPATMDVIKAVQPPFVFLENVPGLLSATVDDESRGSVHYFGEILRDLAESGYDTRWCVLGADDVGAIHHRKRLWIYAANSKHVREGWKENARQSTVTHQGVERLAEKRIENTDSEIKQSDGAESSIGECEESSALEFGNGDIKIFHSDNIGERTQGDKSQALSRECGIPWGESFRSLEDIRRRTDLPQPLVCGGDDGMAFRRNRTRAIGNGQVPVTMAAAYEMLSAGVGQ